MRIGVVGAVRPAADGCSPTLKFVALFPGIGSCRLACKTNILGASSLTCQIGRRGMANTRNTSQKLDQMPRRSLLSESERESLLVLPGGKDDLIRQYSLSDADLALIKQRRGAANRLGFAVQMCLLRYPG